MVKTIESDNSWIHVLKQNMRTAGLFGATYTATEIGLWLMTKSARLNHEFQDLGGFLLVTNHWILMPALAVWILYMIASRSATVQGSKHLLACLCPALLPVGAIVLAWTDIGILALIFVLERISIIN